MDVSDDLVTWLRAQLDKDEAAAAEDLAGYCHDWAVRVLAEVDVKRRILDGYEIAAAGGVIYAVEEPMAMAIQAAIVRLLAFPYADRSGYRQEWAP